VKLPEGMNTSSPTFIDSTAASPPEAAPEIIYYSKLLKSSQKYYHPGQIKQVIDVGCRNWSYVDTFARSFPNANLVGIELDGLRRYWNLYRRIDYARAYAKELQKLGREAEAHLGDFLTLPLQLKPAPTLFSFLFPFVSDNPCLKWGVPKRYSNFSKMIERSLSLAEQWSLPNAYCLSVHQGEWEADIARAAYQKLGLKMNETVLSPEEWAGIWPSPYENWIFVGDLVSIRSHPKKYLA